MDVGPFKRVLAIALGIGGAANGVFMLAAPPLWYDSVPGLAHTGPFNPHFVSDIGVAYLVSGVALIVRAWRPLYWPAAVAGAAFMCGHAIIHVLDIMLADGSGLEVLAEAGVLARTDIAERPVIA